MSFNPNITLEFVSKNSEKPWHWDKIFENAFPEEKKMFIQKKYREYIAAYQIQQWWYKITMSPQYQVGRKLIEKRRLAVYEN